MASKYTPDMFWKKVDIRQDSECWVWTGRRNPGGYGQLRYHGVDVTAHRLAAYLVGMLQTPVGPKDKKGTGFILHQCDNPPCCNPAHLKVGTVRENAIEAVERHRTRYHTGENHHRTKLSDDNVRDIRARWPAESQGVLAAEYGVTQACISLITRKINRANISD